MTFTVGTLSRCSSLGHIDIPVTAAGGAQRTLSRTREEWALDPQDRETAVECRLRSAIKESGATNFAQVRTALEGKTFQV